MVDIMHRLHFSAARLTIKTWWNRSITAIHDIEKVNNIFGDIFLEITAKAPEKHGLGIRAFLFRHRKNHSILG
jgi:hypothetical protein